MRGLPHLLLLPAAAAWSSCDFPSVNWIVADTGVGRSATHKCAGMGNFAYVGGYAGGNTTLASTSSSQVRSPSTRIRHYSSRYRLLASVLICP